MSLNIRSIPKSLDKLLIEFDMLKIDIFCVSETWLNEHIYQLYNMPNFELFSVHRTNKRGGGVAIYVRDFFCATVVGDLCMTSSVIEAVFIEFKWGSTKYLFGNLYRPPASNCIQFLEELNEILQIIDARFCNHLICISGDMNINILKNVTGNHAVQSYLNLMYSYGMLPKILRPTRVTRSTAALIDHIWINRDDRFSSSSICLSDISDHFPTFISLKSGTVRNDDILVRFRNKNVDNWQLFSNRVYSFPWNDLLTSSSADALCGMLLDAL